MIDPIQFQIKNNMKNYEGTYDEFVDELKVSDLPIDRCVMAMCEEVGEAAGKIKRLHRGDYNGAPAKFKFDSDIEKELGDILYYLTCAAHSIGITLADVMDSNVDKLIARREAGTLKGSGDNR